MWQKVWSALLLLSVVAQKVHGFGYRSNFSATFGTDAIQHSFTEGSIAGMKIRLFSAYEWSGSNRGRIFTAGSIVALAYVEKGQLSALENLANQGRIKCRSREATSHSWEGSSSDEGNVKIVDIGENHIYSGTGILLSCNLHPTSPRVFALEGSSREVAFIGATANTPMPKWISSVPSISVVQKATHGRLEGRSGTHVCVNTVYGSRLSPLWLLEYLLYYRAIGADRVHIYNYGDIPVDAAVVLKELDSGSQVYGFVVNHDFRGIGCGHRVSRCEAGKVPLWSHGQLFAIHDCVFRAGLAGAKYVISGDIDEVLYISEGRDLTDALSTVFRAQSPGQYEGFTMDGQRRRACSMTHTYTVLGEGLLSGETSRSLALAGVRVKSRAQRNGIGSGGEGTKRVEVKEV